jgi:hypothetical protein
MYLSRSRSASPRNCQQTNAERLPHRQTPPELALLLHNCTCPHLLETLKDSAALAGCLHSPQNWPKTSSPLGSRRLSPAHRCQAPRAPHFILPSTGHGFEEKTRPSMPQPKLSPQISPCFPSMPATLRTPCECIAATAVRRRSGRLRKGSAASIRLAE